MKYNIINHLFQQLEKQLDVLQETERLILSCKEMFGDIVGKNFPPELQKRKKEVLLTSNQLHQLANEI